MPGTPRMNRMRVGFVFGGKAVEHEHSIKSALYLLSKIDPERYDWSIFYLDADGRLPRRNRTAETLKEMLSSHGSDIFMPGEEIPPDFQERLTASIVEDETGISDARSFLRAFSQHPADIYFPVFHGQNGEDALVQGLFELMDAPYAGCGVLGSAVGNDKELNKHVIRGRGIPVTDFHCCLRDEWEADGKALAGMLESDLGYPLFVKPTSLGSSIGVSRVTNREELFRAVQTVLALSGRVLFEREVKGREYGIGVIGNGHCLTSAIVEFGGDGSFMDYAAKYGAAAVVDRIPAPLPRELEERVRELAVTAYHALDLSGMARIDFFITDGGTVLFNEANTVPGFGRTSVFSKIWEAAGVPPSSLIDRLIAYGMERFHGRQGLRYSLREAALRETIGGS